MKCIVFANQKGGCTKSSSCRELGIALSCQGYKTLLLDMDPQGNLSKSLVKEGPGLYDTLTSGEIIIEEISPTLSLLTGDIRLSLLEKNLLGEIDAHLHIKDLLVQDPFANFDYILIDTPPSLGILTLNALTAAHHIVIPITCKLYSLQGTNDLMDTIGKVRRTLNPNLNILGVLIGMYDRIPVITQEIREEIESSFGDLVFPVVISKSIRVEEAIAQKKGIVELPIKDRIKKEIEEAVQELVRRSSL